jgi:hypothetical protein
MGRQTKLTPEIREIFEKNIRAGIPAEHICPMVGIHKSTFYEWMKKGREAKRKDQYQEFSDAIEGAKSKYLAGLVVMLTNHVKESYDKSKLDPYLILKILNMRDRDNWGERVVQEHTGAITVIRSATPRPQKIVESDGT